MSVTRDDLRHGLRSLLLDAFAPGLTDLADDVDLGAVGALDSMRMIEFVLAVERRFGLRIEAAEITPENFSTIAAMVDFLGARLGAA